MPMPETQVWSDGGSNHFWPALAPAITPRALSVLADHHVFVSTDLRSFQRCVPIEPLVSALQ
jgi:hypothetical protein